ncbi:MAG TPA: hypothetical protein VGF37_09990 [Chthoniobacterales bacterium]
MSCEGRRKKAAHADFSLLLGGHTHGGQICLAGSIPITLDSVLPRYMASGPWKYHDMVGTHRLASDRASLPYVSTAHRKSHCITFKLPDRPNLTGVPSRIQWRHYLYTRGGALVLKEA